MQWTGRGSCTTATMQKVSYHEIWTLKRARHEVGIIEPLEPRFHIRCRYRKPRVADKYHEKKVPCKWKVDDKQGLLEEHTLRMDILCPL